MNREGAKLILKTWVECPVCFGNQNCPKDEEERCKAWCWSQNEVKEAVGVMLNDNKVTGWIPVSERLPEVAVGTEDENCPEFNVTIKGAKESTTLSYSWDETWFDNSGNIYEVLAWMPLPEPYKLE